MRLKDNVSIITGGSHGIGFDTADKFLKEGATVILTTSSQTSADNAVAQLKEQHPMTTVAGIPSLCLEQPKDSRQRTRLSGIRRGDLHYWRGTECGRHGKHRKVYRRDASPNFQFRFTTHCVTNLSRPIFRPQTLLSHS